VGVLRDPNDQPVGPFIKKPDRRYGDAIADTYKSLFEDYTKSGKGPVYMDGRGMSAEDYQYMMHWMRHEGNTAIVNHLKEEGVDLRKNPVEFMTYEMTTRGGISYNEKAETSMKGLYAAGDEYFGGASGAATFGWIAGENAAGYAKKVGEPRIQKARGEIDKKKDFLEKIRHQETGIPWQEVNIALNQIMFDYVGSIRYENMLEAGYSHLQRLKKKAYGNLMAKNQHELMHCLEVLNLLDIAEAIFIAVLERKETRDKYARLDYPFTNPMLDGKMLVCKRKGNKPVAEWREIKR
jgi:succinate dehydrogenase/fumarate reductase flavoprotein subunit